MLPWLLPAGLIALVVAGTILPGWLFILLAVLVLLVVAPLVLRSYFSQPSHRLPDWWPGGRPPR